MRSRTSPLDGLRSPFGRRRGIGGGGAGGMVNTTLPSIVGLYPANSNWELDVGYWSGPVTGFEIEVLQTSPNLTLLTRQVVTGATIGTLTPAVGSSMVLNVWALDGLGNKSPASSVPFGPITAAADEFIRGLVVNPSSGFNPQPSGHPYSPMRLLSVDPSNNPYDSGLGYGWVGSNTTGHLTRTLMSRTLLKGAVNFNVAITSLALRIDLPSPGNYIVYCGLGITTTVTPRMQIRDGSASGTILMDINTANASVLNYQVMDAAGNVTGNDGADWAAASLPGGVGVPITTTTSALFIGQPALGQQTRLNTITIMKAV